MREISIAEINIALVEIFGIFALVTGFLVWRAPEAGAVRVQLEALRAWDQVGFHVQWIAMSRLFVWMRVFVWLVFISLALIGVCGETKVYLDISQQLVGSGSALDFALIEELRVRASESQQMVVGSGFAAAGAAVLDWLAATYLQHRFRPMDSCRVEGSGHPSVVPTEWVDAWSAMWETRVEASGSVYSQISQGRAPETDDWREQWPAWASRVVAYHVRVEQDVQESGGGDIPLG